MKRSDLVGKIAKATFLMANIGKNTGVSGWWCHEEKTGVVIYADDKKCTIKTNKGVPMCFDLCEVDFL
jgi:hypothetical protein